MNFPNLRPYLLLTCMAAVSMSAHATDGILRGPEPDWVIKSELTPVSDDATGLAITRRDDLFTFLGTETDSVFRSQRVRILDSRALDIGNLGLTWNPDAGAPTVHHVKAHRDGEEIDVLDSTEFEILRREDHLEHAMLDGHLTALLRVPDLRVGDELDYAFTIPTRDVTISWDSFGLKSYAMATLPGRYRLGLRWDESQKPNYRFTDDFRSHDEYVENGVIFTFDDPDLLTPANDVPPRYNWKRILEYSDFRTCEDVSSRFHELYVPAMQLGADSKVKAEANRIARAHDAPMDRIKAALKLVQQQVRYVYVGMEGGNYDPVPAEETWSLRYGDCKGKSALLAALLAELGIEAELALVSNSGIDDGLIDRLPSPALFDHIVVRASSGGRTYWLDPTMPRVIGPSETPLLNYRWTLPLSKNGSDLEKLDNHVLRQPSEMALVRIDSSNGFEKPAPVTSVSVKRGMKAVGEYIQHLSLSASQIETIYKTQLAQSEAWESVDSVSYRFDEDTQASILTIVGTWEIDWDEDPGDRYDLALPGGGFSPPSKRKKRSDHSLLTAPYYSKPSYSCHVTTVVLPKDTDLENWGYNTVYETKMFGRRYYRMMEKRDDHTIRMVRGSRVEDPEISYIAADIQNNGIDSFDNSKVVIEYNSNDTLTPYSFHRPVPATDEIDWIADSSHCLPLEK